MTDPSPVDQLYSPPLSLGELRVLLKEGNALIKADDPSAAYTLVWGRLRERPPGAEGLERLARWISKWARAAGAVPTQRVRLLAQWTGTWLCSALKVEAWLRGAFIEVTEGAYDQVIQESLQPFEAEIVILLPGAQRLLATGEVEGELGYWRQVWANLQRPAPDRPPVKLLQVGYDLPGAGPLGFSLGGQPGQGRALIREMNDALRAALPASSYFVDLEALAGALGRRAFYDPRQQHWTKQPLSAAGLQELAALLWAGIRALTTGPKKVLVLDLDNTLWGGVVGDEGATGVQVGAGPEGEAFSTFQRHCKTLRERGIVLAAASKNNLEDAQGPFREHPEMVLQLDDFAAFEAHWESKVVSLQRIAETLRLGLDSFVFFDDHPVERATVRDLLPAVEVVDVPPEPARYVEALERGLWFEAAGLTAEDLSRAEGYRQEGARRSLSAEIGSLDGYLETLEMVGDLRPLTAADLPRVLQLIGKTNQFNFTTRRHSQGAVEALLERPRSIALTLRVSDRFGDYGLVSLLLAAPDPEQPTRLLIDTWLMSCRVIGRSVEQFFFTAITERARTLAYEELEALYIPTKKNQLIAGLLPSLGGLEMPSEQITDRLSEAEKDRGARGYRFPLETLELPRNFLRTVEGSSP